MPADLSEWEKASRPGYVPRGVAWGKGDIKSKYPTTNNSAINADIQWRGRIDRENTHILGSAAGGLTKTKVDLALAGGGTGAADALADDDSCDASTVASAIDKLPELYRPIVAARNKRAAPLKLEVPRAFHGSDDLKGADLLAMLKSNKQHHKSRNVNVMKTFRQAHKEGRAAHRGGGHGGHADVASESKHEDHEAVTGVGRVTLDVQEFKAMNTARGSGTPQESHTRDDGLVSGLGAVSPRSRSSQLDEKVAKAQEASAVLKQLLRKRASEVSRLDQAMARVHAYDAVVEDLVSAIDSAASSRAVSRGSRSPRSRLPRSPRAPRQSPRRSPRPGRPPASRSRSPRRLSSMPPSLPRDAAKDFLESQEGQRKVKAIERLLVAQNPGITPAERRAEAVRLVSSGR